MLEQLAPSWSTMLDVSDVVASVRLLIEDDSIAGSALVLTGGERPHFLQTV